MNTLMIKESSRSYVETGDTQSMIEEIRTLTEVRRVNDQRIRVANDLSAARYRNELLYADDSISNLRQKLEMMQIENEKIEEAALYKREIRALTEQRMDIISGGHVSRQTTLEHQEPVSGQYSNQMIIIAIICITLVAVVVAAN